MKLLEYLPENYAQSPETVEIQNALDVEVDALIHERDFLFLQLDLDTATGWGLELWEQAYAVQTDVTKNDEYRRTRVKAKMRGASTTTVALIKNISESFSNGEVEVIEKPHEYKFLVKFVGVKGIPPNMDDLKSAIDEAKPAHLNYEFVFTYNTHKDLIKLTHAKMAAYTHTELREKE